uniref:C-type lectin domain-containing protein n=1 Tax=Esox lucius TaxID=8010 RepID=A0A6Q2YH85_ESOLU
LFSCWSVLPFLWEIHIGGHTGALGNGASLVPIVIFDETPRSWADAEFHCQSLGGHLASVHSWLESIFLKALTFDLPLTWIGGTDGGQPEMSQYKSWSWTDGSGFNYQQWAEGMPNNSIGGELCIQMNFGGTVIH